MLVDNRAQDESVPEPHKNNFRGSAFKGKIILI